VCTTAFKVCVPHSTRINRKDSLIICNVAFHHLGTYPTESRETWLLCFAPLPSQFFIHSFTLPFSLLDRKNLLKSQCSSPRYWCNWQYFLKCSQNVSYLGWFGRCFYHSSKKFWDFQSYAANFTHEVDSNKLREQFFSWSTSSVRPDKVSRIGM